MAAILNFPKCENVGNSHSRWTLNRNGTLKKKEAAQTVVGEKLRPKDVEVFENSCQETPLDSSAVTDTAIHDHLLILREFLMLLESVEDNAVGSADGFLTTFLEAAEHRYTLYVDLLLDLKTSEYAQRDVSTPTSVVLPPWSV